MDELTIRPTNKTLQVYCGEGKIEFEGCSITNDPRVFFKPIQEWVKEYGKNPPALTEVKLCFEYIDTASVKWVYQILQELKLSESDNHKIKVEWRYETDDPEILELGEIIQSKLDVEFEFVEYEEEE